MCEPGKPCPDAETQFGDRKTTFHLSSKTVISIGMMLNKLSDALKEKAEVPDAGADVIAAYQRIKAVTRRWRPSRKSRRASMIQCISWQ